METLKSYLDRKVIGRIVSSADLKLLSGISAAKGVYPTLSRFADAHGLQGRQHLNALITRGAVIEKRPNGDGAVMTKAGKMVFVIKGYEYAKAVD